MDMCSIMSQITKALSCFIITGLTLSVSFWSITAGAADYDWDKLFQGEVVLESVEKDEIPGVKASFVVKAEASEIWVTLVDYKNFTDIFLEMDRVKVLEQDSDGARVEFWLTIFFVQYHYTLYRHYEPLNNKITWQRVSGDLKKIFGAWEILPTPRTGQHLVIYESYVDPGGLIPLGLIRWRSKQKAGAMAERLRSWIEGRPLQDNAGEDS